MSAEDVGGGLLEDGEVEGRAAVPDVGGEHGGADAAWIGSWCGLGAQGKMRYS